MIKVCPPLPSMKFITLTDIIKGIAFSIGLIVVGFLFIVLFSRIAGVLFEKTGPLTFIIGSAVFIILWVIIVAFSKAVQAGASIKHFFDFKNKDNK